MASVIEAVQLRKEYKIPKRKEGSFAAVRSLLSREYTTKVALEDVSFKINEGEMVGYVGPNGAGKSSTIKILTGILVPSSGECRVRGLVPYKNRTGNAQQIGVVFGQRTQLWWDLPTIESFELLKYMYKVPNQTFKRNLDRFCDVLGLSSFLNTPVRQLSLGQRMRAELAAALIHEPPLVFLDEPTIGLDVVAKENIREFIRDMNRQRGVTVILTTHDMQDIEKLCERMLLIDKGHVVYDGPLKAVKERFGVYRTLVIDLQEMQPEGAVHVEGAHLTRSDGTKHWLRFDRNAVSASELIGRASAKYNIRDLAVEEPDIDSVIKRIYQEGL